MIEKCFKGSAIFGGSFNPIHLGHLHLAQAVQEEFELSEIIFMPTGQPPHKEDTVKNNKEHRYAMVQAAIRSNSLFKPSRFELDRDGYSYTADTLREMRNKLSDDEALYFIIGADSLVQMHHWKSPEEIFALCEIIAIDRPGICDKDVTAAVDNLSARYGAKIHLLKAQTYPLSSSEIRTRAQAGKSIKYFVPDEVLEYIDRHKLYHPLTDPCAIKLYLESNLSPKRYAHSIRSADFACQLAKVHGEDSEKAYLAGLLHDIAKEMSPEEAQKYSSELDESKLSFTDVAHSFIGAEAAGNIFGIQDIDILNAIRYHTTARLNMSALEKIIFIADKIEEGRNYPESDYLKALAESDLDKATLAILQITTSIAQSKGKQIHPLSLEVLKSL